MRSLIRKLTKPFRILFRSRTRKLMTPPVFKPRMSKKERNEYLKSIRFDNLSREGKRQALRKIGGIR